MVLGKAHWGKQLSNFFINWITTIPNKQSQLKKEKLQTITHIEHKQGNYTHKPTKRNLKKEVAT